MRARRRELDSVTPLWLSHHWPEDYDRCLVVGGRHVCRRCAVLYPLALVTMVASLLLLPPTWGPDPWLLVLLPLPAVIELVGEQAGVLRHRPRRQVAVTVPLGVALGRGFARYLEHPADPLFWGVVAAYSAVAGGAVVWRVCRDHRRAGGSADGTP